LPRLGAPPGPLPRNGRIVFDRDALWYSGAFTLGELLRQVPGVFLVRGGWYGQPEVVHYAGQGASSVELYWDGFALDPMGADSNGVDLSTISLGMLQRVEVEVLPTVLRVYLFSDAQPLRKPRTETSFATGDASTNTYRIRYLNRWPGGAGLGLGIEDLSTGSALAGSGGSNTVDLWAKGSFAPAPTYGVEYEALSVSLDRSPFGTPGVGGSAGSRTSRAELFLRGFAATRPDGMGLRLDAIAGSSTSTDTIAGLSRDELQGAVVVGYRAERWSGELTTRVRDTQTPLEVQLRAAVSPVSMLTVSGSYDARSIVGGRRALDASLVAELRPWAPLALHGSARLRHAIGSPATLSDTVQRVTDVEAGVSLTSRLADLDVSVARHGAYAAPVYGSFGPTTLSYPDLPVRTATVSFALRPTLFFTVAGWYRRPLDPVTSAYEPPDHSHITATLRTRLLPILRRGAFDFTAEAGLEGWGRGAIGDSSSVPIALQGATVVDFRLEIRLVSAALFWTLRNMRGERYALVPGIAMPSAAQRYGIRWEFTN
jgi:TonB-dependent Receptor Plug Domain